MTVTKKIFACIGIFCVLIMVFTVPCFAYSYVHSSGDLTGSVGLPFIFTTNANIATFGGYDTTKFITSGFGSVPYYSDVSTVPDYYNGFYSPEDFSVVGGAEPVGDLYFYHSIDFGTVANPWYSDAQYSYNFQAFNQNTTDYFSFTTPAQRVTYIQQEIRSANNAPFNLGYTLFYNDVISCSLLPYIGGTSDYFPLSFDVTVFTNKNYVLYDANGVLNRTGSNLSNYGAVVGIEFEVAEYYENSIEWVTKTIQANIYNAFISDNIVFNDLGLNSYAHIMSQGFNFAVPLNYTVSMYPVYNAILSVTSRDSYIRNLKLNIAPTPLNPTDPDFRQYVDSPVLAYIDNRLGYQSTVLPSFEFSLNYNGASYDYTGVDGSFDNSRITGGNVYLTDGEFNLVNWLGDTVGGILDVPLIGNPDGAYISIGTILYVCVGAGILMLLLKLFAGG